ncbi:MAG TPA: GHMP kinase [Symbiobacteriaceae bacterium]|nr:GHMP kinase [Symbiobacteriaceae bacterium]
MVMRCRARAPLRVSFAGGGTDIAPYPQERGGVVLSATVDKYAYATLQARHDSQVQITSLDYDTVVKYHVHQLMFDGKLDLAKAAILNVGPLQHGIDLFLHCDAPPGSGLGSSSALVVATIGVLNHLLGRHLSQYDMAKLAYEVERVDLGIQGGMQDQYSAVFGGFNFIEFRGRDVVVNPLRLSPATVNELQYHLLLCYTGKTRLSANIIAEQQQAYEQKDTAVLGALDELKAITIDMKNALLQSRFDDFGDLLHAGWENKKKLARGVTSPEIDQLYSVAREHGALGGKILGAGGGGYLLVFCPFDRKHLIAAALEKAGGEIEQFSFDFHGLQTWTAPAPRPAGDA